MFKTFKNEREFKKKHLNLEYRKAVASIRSLEEVEREYILKTYNVMGKSISKASRLLGVSRNTIYIKFTRYEEQGFL